MSDIVVAATVRIGTVERERAARDLGDHFAAGRLEAEEFDERVGRVYTARTAGDLSPLFADLPSLAPVLPPVRQRPRRVVPARSVLIILAVLAAVCWTALVRMPPLFLFVLLWFGFGRHSARRRYSGRY